jgi:predicted aldo/keto reductase-like oxidoreductase
MNDFLEQRPIGRTGLMSSRLGIGSTFDAPASAIEDAFDRGINYLYWGTVRQPEFARAMRNLEKQHRDELILTIQSYSRDPGTIEAEIAECIKTAGVGEFDFLLLGSRDDVPEDAYVEVFERMRDKGMVRFLSLSSHNRPMLPTLLAAYENDTSPYDLLMLRYNAHLLDPEKMPPGEAPVSARDCFRYSLSHDAIDMVLCGPANAEQLNDAIAALERGPLEPDERERIERIGAYLYGEYAPAYPDKGDANDVTAGVAAQ